MKNNKFTPPHYWICEEKRPLPQTKDGCAPAITATYEYASFANMVTTAHFPRMGVLEIGHYGKRENGRKKNDGTSPEREDSL